MRLTTNMLWLGARKLGLGVALAALLADALTKWGALALAVEGGRVVIPGFFWLVLAFNRGFSFSMLGHTTVSVWGIPADVWVPVLLGGGALVMVGFFLMWMGEKATFYHQMGVGLIVGGALGNLIDRMIHGAVVDFLLFNLGPLWPWGAGFFPAFNVADACISIGVVLLLIDGYLETRQQKGI